MTLVIVAAMIAPAMAHAGMNLTVRSDWNNTMEYKNTADVKGGSSSIFAPAYARLNGTAKVGDADVKSSFQLRGAGAMTWNDFTQYLYISKAHDMFTFTAGKLETPNGGFERLAIDSGDSYMNSMANGGAINDVGGAATPGSAVTSLQNTSGFGIGWGADHKLTFQALNEQSVGADNNKRHSVGLGYAGAFSDWAVRAAYYAGATDAGTTAAPVESNQTYMNAGVSGNVAGFGMTFDYIANTSEGKATGSVESKTTSMVALFSYDMGMYKPQLKIESSTNKEGAVGDVGDVDRMGLAAALEIKPSDDDFRYHVAYVMTNDKYKEAALTNDKVNASTLIVGLKYTGDLLK